MVDDDRAIRELVCAVLADAGYGTVSEAHDGVEALLILQLSPTPMLVVCDSRMPRLNGLGLLEALTTDGPALCRHAFLLMTGNADQFTPTQRRLLERHRVAIVHKPFDLQPPARGGQGGRRTPPAGAGGGGHDRRARRPQASETRSRCGGGATCHEPAHHDEGKEDEGRSGPSQSRFGWPFQLGRPFVRARSSAESLRDGLRGGLGGSGLAFSSAGTYRTSARIAQASAF